MNKIKVSEHFSLHEFECPCCNLVKLDERLVFTLEELRARLCLKYMTDIPVIINSGYRCKKHNKEIKGASKSDHLYGWASDIICVKNGEILDTQVILEIARCISDIKRIGFSKNFIHIGIQDRIGFSNFWEY